MMPTATLMPVSPALLSTGQQPNELDLRRLKRMLAKRERYRYVTVRVTPTTMGYLITSPCCSRVVSAEGALIDIALIEYEATSERWTISSKNHIEGQWDLQRCAEALRPLVEYLLRDPARVFWQ